MQRLDFPPCWALGVKLLQNMHFGKVNGHKIPKTAGKPPFFLASAFFFYLLHPKQLIPNLQVSTTLSDASITDYSFKEPRNGVDEFLQLAKPSFLSIHAWKETWVGFHGWGRALAEYKHLTFHLAGRLVQNCYETCILAKSEEIPNAKLLQTTIFKWGATKTVLTNVLVHYQDSFGVVTDCLRAVAGVLDNFSLHTTSFLSPFLLLPQPVPV